jgi:hypothetical protein
MRKLWYMARHTYQDAGTKFGTVCKLCHMAQHTYQAAATERGTACHIVPSELRNYEPCAVKVAFDTSAVQVPKTARCAAIETCP